jgi:hypothetical protein
MPNEPTEDKNSLDPGGGPGVKGQGTAPRAASLPPELDPELNNTDSTPGTGMLPELGEDADPNAQPSS